MLMFLTHFFFPKIPLTQSWNCVFIMYNPIGNTQLLRQQQQHRMSMMIIVELPPLPPLLPPRLLKFKLPPI